MSHTSHMYPVYPGELITETRTPGLFEAARRGQKEASSCQKTGRLARLLEDLPDGPVQESTGMRHLLKSTGEGLGAGMMTNVNQQIDAIFGLGAGIAEMLLQSHQGFIELLPAVPVDWADGHFRGMQSQRRF